ncbi:MAG: hypothetical protein ACRDT0_15795 [Pseudonocardiaceae bacterium]
MDSEPARPSNSDALNTAMQEYNALRGEITSRHGAQHTLINLDVTAIGILLGVVLSNKENLIILLVVPIVATSFGLLYFDQAGSIERIGVYIRHVLQPAIARLTGDTATLAWEDFAARTFRASKLSVVGFAVPVFIIFIGTPIAATIVLLPAITQAWQWLFWVLGVVFEAMVVGVWYSFFSGRSLRANQRAARGS